MQVLEPRDPAIGPTHPPPQQKHSRDRRGAFADAYRGPAGLRKTSAGKPNHSHTETSGVAKTGRSATQQ